MAKLYRIHEFAERAGVTPKALRHYERLGLLKPARSASGYRLYSKSDRMRIDQIVTLKFLGIPLREIRALLDHPEPSLPEALRRQRVRLEERQRLLTRAIRAIEDAERTLDPDASLSALWKKIVEVVAMQSDSEAMKKYYSEEAWAKRLQHYEQWPPAEFDDLFREISAALEEDPGGEKAQELKKRWIQVLNPRVTGDPEVQEGALTAWNDREHWPASLRVKVQELKVEQVVDFLARVLSANWKKYITSEEWTKLPESRRYPTEPWNQWVLRIQTALEEDPVGENARAVVLRAMEL